MCYFILNCRSFTFENVQLREKGLRSLNPTARDPKNVWTAPRLSSYSLSAESWWPSRGRHEHLIFFAAKRPLALPRGKHIGITSKSPSPLRQPPSGINTSEHAARKKMLKEPVCVCSAVNAPSCFIQLVGQINMKVPQFSLTAAVMRSQQLYGVSRAQSEGLCVLRCQKCTRRLLDFSSCAMRLNLMRNLHACRKR